MYHVDKLENNIINFSLNLLEKFKKNKKDISFNTFTKNGFQTPNVIKHYTDKNKKLLLKNLFKIEDLFHLHLIEYYKEGYQDLHDHKKTEKFSFILYLNDSDGETIFHFKDRKITEIPVKGKIIYFNSDILHLSTKSYLNKKVLVGAINKNENNR